MSLLLLISFAAVQGRVKHSFHESIIRPRAWWCITQFLCLTIMLFWHESVSGTESPTSNGDSYQKNPHIFCLTVELCHWLLRFCPQPRMVCVGFRFFWKGQLSQFLFFGVCNISPVQIGCHIPFLLRWWKRPSAGGPACCATASCVQTILAVAEKLSIPLHPMDTMSLSSLSSLERSTSLSSSTSLFPLFSWHKFRLWTVRQTVHSEVVVIIVHRRMCKRRSDWNRNRNRNLSPKSIMQNPSSGNDVHLFSPLSTNSNLEQPSSYVQHFIGCFPFHVFPIFTYLSPCTFHGHHFIEPGSSLALGNT